MSLVSLVLVLVSPDIIGIGICCLVRIFLSLDQQGEGHFDLVLQIVKLAVTSSFFSGRCSPWCRGVGDVIAHIHVPRQVARPPWNVLRRVRHPTRLPCLGRR